MSKEKILKTVRESNIEGAERHAEKFKQMTKPTEKKEGWGTGHPKEPITKPTELEKIIRNLEVRHTISGNMIEGEEEVVEKLQTLIKEERKKAVEGFVVKIIKKYNLVIEEEE